MTELYYTISELLEGTYTARILTNFSELFVTVFPYLILSILINTLIRKYFTKLHYFKTAKGELGLILIAGLVGIISPLPTYLAVPISLTLLGSGLPFSVIATFIISSPLINPGIFILTWSQLGIFLALSRVLSAFILGVLAGFLVKYFNKFNIKQTHRATSSQIENRSFLKELKSSLLFIGKYFVIALLIASAVKSFLPYELVNQIFTKFSNLSLIIAIILGVPFYSCGGAAIPLIKVLQEMGLNNGAILAFFIAGPATKLQTLYVYKTSLGIKLFLYYLGYTLVGATLCGYLLLILS
ncbi:MAG: permease [Candidatus Marinimicrobia bacterium]|nr:permease [Candidatus Neomarinimicrobiota bacterium]